MATRTLRARPVNSRSLFFITSPRTPFKAIPEIALLDEELHGEIWDSNTQSIFYHILKDRDFFEGNEAKDFLLRTNGAEFDMGVLYDTDSIAEMYEALGFSDYAPEYISIGNDNGDYELVMRADEDAKSFGLLEQGSIGILEPQKIHDFNAWLKNGCPFDFFTE